MKFKIKIIKKRLEFKTPAGTSRGIYKTRDVWYVILKNNELYGVGEAAPLPLLSCDYITGYEDILKGICNEIEQRGDIGGDINGDIDISRAISVSRLIDYPSILFALESAFCHLRAKSMRFWNTPFSMAKEGIPINGLIWMGSFDEMKSRIEEKLSSMWACIKIKIGSIDFNNEIELIKIIRSRYSSSDVEIRVDANGAFTPGNVMRKLEVLSKYSIHSIEQPIMARQIDEMAKICKSSPIPIALDEELIGNNKRTQKEELLNYILPQYIILKPSLHGGLSGCDEWIKIAEDKNIGYWVTSALESNVGLNAIAQWCATKSHNIHQGLGTGSLFYNNIDYPLSVRDNRLWMNDELSEPDFSEFL